MSFGNEDSNPKVIRLFDEVSNLIRDNVPKAMEDKSSGLEVKTLSEDEFHSELLHGIVNHLNGYMIAKDHNFDTIGDDPNVREHAISDIVRMIDMLYNLATMHNLTEDDIDQRRKELLDKYGGFNNRYASVMYYRKG